MSQETAIPRRIAALGATLDFHHGLLDLAQLARALAVLEGAAPVFADEVVPLFRVAGAHAADLRRLVIERTIALRADESGWERGRRCRLSAEVASAEAAPRPLAWLLIGRWCALRRRTRFADGVEQPDCFGENRFGDAGLQQHAGCSGVERQLEVARIRIAGHDHDRNR